MTKYRTVPAKKYADFTPTNPFGFRIQSQKEHLSGIESAWETWSDMWFDTQEAADKFILSKVNDELRYLALVAEQNLAWAEFRDENPIKEYNNAVS